MKKTLLSLVLCVALLMTAVSAMVAMPASAADDINVLLGELGPGGDGTASGVLNDDGSVTVTNTGAGEVGINLGEGGISVITNPSVVISVNSDVDFNIAFYDGNNDKWIFMAGDYYPAFNEQVSGSDANAIKAGSYTNVKFDLQGAYKWNPETGKSDKAVPDNAAITGLYIVPKAAGTMTITKFLFTDGVDNVPLNSRGDVSETEWASRENLLDNEYVADKVEGADGSVSNLKVVKNDDGSVVFGNDNGMWPSANYTFAEAIHVNTSAALDMDFTVAAGAKTTIYLFLGPTTPDEFATGEYVTVVNPADILTLELGPGEYKGVYFLEDLITATIANLDNKANCYDEDGKIIIKGMKIFATSDAAMDSAVTVRKMDLVALADGDEDKTPSTTEKGATTTNNAVAPGGTTNVNGDSATTTVAKGDSNGGNSVSTGDVSDAALFIVVAFAAVAVVTLSVVASKKAKSR